MSIELVDSNGPLTVASRIYGSISGTQRAKSFSPDLIVDYVRATTDGAYASATEFNSLDDYVASFTLQKDDADNTKWDGQDLIARGFASATGPTDLVVYQQLQDAILASTFDAPGLTAIDSVDSAADLLIVYDNSAGGYRKSTPAQLFASMDADIIALGALSSTGIAVRTASNTWAQRSIAGPAAGITVTNGDGVSGNPTLGLANDLSALEGLASTGFAVRSASDTWIQRLIAGTTNEITVTNGNGVSGNPTISLPSALDFTGKTITGGTFTAASLTVTGGEIRNQNNSAFYSFYNSAGSQRNGYVQMTATDSVIVTERDAPLRFLRNSSEVARFDETTNYFGLFNTDPQYPFDMTGLGNFSLRPLANGKAARLNVDYHPSPTAGSNLANSTYDGFGIMCLFPSGKLMMIYRQGNTHVDDAGAENDFGIIVSRTSTDGGKTWSSTTTIRSVANEDLRNIGGGVTPSGRCVLAFYRYNADTSLAANALMTSDDEGVTWSSPTEITAGVANSPYGGLITIGDNKVAISLYGGGTGLIVTSSDDFRTWSSAVAIGSASPTRSETSIVYLGGGTILALGRVEAGSGTVAFRQHKSTDNGSTWTDQGATTFDTWSYAYGHPPWLQRFRGPDGQLKVVCYYLDRDDTTLKAVYADAKELVSTGVSAWDTNNKITIASGMIVGGSGYPAVIHAYDNPAGIGWYYNETVTDDTTEIVTLVTPTTFPTTVGGPFGAGVTQPLAAGHFAPLNQLSSVPAAGTTDVNVGLFLSQPDKQYGLLAGSLNSGKGFIQAQRVAGGATTYNLQLQPNGGAVEVGSTIELGHASDTTLSRVSAGVAAIEGVNILTAATGQPLDSDLTAIAALTPTNDDIIQRKAGAWTNRTMAQLIADLGALGTTFQPLDSDLTSWAGVTRASGFDTFVATPSSANLRALITDEASGSSGALYFVGGALGTPASGALGNCTGYLLSALVGDTTTALGVGSLNIGHASDTTLARAASGRLTVESVAIMRGPGSSTDNTIPRFDATTGDLLQTSGVYIDDSDNLGVGGAPSYKADFIGNSSGSVIGRIFNSNATTGVAAFRWQTGSANCVLNYELYNNSGAAYLVFGSGSAVTDVYTDFSTHHFRSQAGSEYVRFASGASYFPNVTTTASAANAFLDSGSSPANSLLRSTSSRKYKRDIESLSFAYAKRLLDMRPVWYRSDTRLCTSDNPKWGFYGLIAEEVAEIDPRLVHWGYQEDQYEEFDEEYQALEEVTENIDATQTKIVSRVVTKTRKAKRLKAGEQKRPDGVQYERVGVLNMVLIQDHESRINVLEGSIKTALAEITENATLSQIAASLVALKGALA